jgi:hypothetical protein
MNGVFFLANVLRVLRSRCEPTIFRRVVAICVNAVDFETGGVPMRHAPIGKRHEITTPSRVHDDSATAVPWVRRIFFSVASPFDPLPNPMKCRACQPMLRTRLNPETSARPALPQPQVRLLRKVYFSAGAFTDDADFSIEVKRKPNNRESVKRLPDLHGLFAP